MIATDFCYDGVWLSDLGYIICQFDEDGGFVNSTAGSQLTFNRVSQFGGRRNTISGATYSEPFQADIEICKPEGESFDMAEYGKLMRWLNRTEDYELQLRVECCGTQESSDYDDIYFMGTFNAEQVTFHGDIIGFTLHFEADAPFGYGMQRRYKFTVAANGSFNIVDMSDEIGYIYPDYMEIKCLSAGDLELTNEIERRTTIIKNMSENEVLRFDGSLAIIQSSDENHKVLNDFNFIFFRIANKYDTSRNIVTSSLPCEIEIVYTPIRKVVF